MDNKAILSEIAKHSTILDFHIKRLNKRPEQLHDIDIEMMGEKVKEIYFLVNNLLPEDGGFEVSSEFEEREAKNEERETKKEEREAKSEEPVIKEEPVASSSQPPDPSPVPRPSSPEPISASPDPQPAPPDPHPAYPETPESDTPKTTADLFSGPTTIADKFQAREDNSIGAKVNTQPAEDLKMSIGINDKFLFINELFQGDPSVYNMAIENMNAAGGLDDAIKSIDTYREKYQWADNSEAYHRLKKIVNSKFNG